MAAAAGDEELDSLLRNFHRFSQVRIDAAPAQVPEDLESPSAVCENAEPRHATVRVLGWQRVASDAASVEVIISGDTTGSTTHEDEQGRRIIANGRWPIGYKDALMEVQALRLSCSSESKKREALESHIVDLKQDNERLRRLYTETLFKFTNQMKFHTESKSLKEELAKANSRLLSMEEEHKTEIEQLKHGNEMTCNALKSKLSCALAQQTADETAIKQLKLDLEAHKAHIDMLSSKLEQVTADNNDLQDLKDVIMVEQEEKKDMARKLKNAENELRIMKMKQAEQQRDSISVQHVETLKQKVMKLRKENESLKRKLASSEPECS